MSTIRKNKPSKLDIIDYIHNYDIDIDRNHIYLFGIDDASDDGTNPGVEYKLANRFIKNMNICKTINPDKPLIIHMKISGGDWVEGMAIYDAIKTYPYKTIIISWSEASSMSSIILQAANKRFLTKNSHVLIHSGSLDFDATFKQVKSLIKFERYNEQIMMNIYANALKQNGIHSKKSLHKIKLWLRTQLDKSEDVYYRADQAIKLGFADHIYLSDENLLENI